MILDKLFASIADLRNYVPDLEANKTFASLNASAVSAYKQICIIISKEVYKTISEIEDTPEPDEKKEALKTAIANLTISKQLVFDTINRRKNNIEVYKYELEEMKRNYQASYYDAMDTLISLLNESDINAWKTSTYYKLIDSLKIKNAQDFDAIYPIDQSYLFFFRCIPLQKEVIDEKMEGIFSRAINNESATALLNRALAKYVISKALRRFDILEFPEVIRGLFKDSKIQRYGTQEQEQILRIADSLDDEADNLIKDVDVMLTDDTATNIVTQTSFNQPDDKIFLMP